MARLSIHPDELYNSWLTARKYQETKYSLLTVIRYYCDYVDAMRTLGESVSCAYERLPDDMSDALFGDPDILEICAPVNEALNLIIYTNDLYIPQVTREFLAYPDRARSLRFDYFPLKTWQRTATRMRGIAKKIDKAVDNAHKELKEKGLLNE